MFKVSCVQFTSGEDVKENLKKILNIIYECIKEKSDLIITPENTSIMSSNKKELLSKLNVMEDDIFLKEFKRVCKSNRKWIILGSIIVKISKDTLANRSILINPNGDIEKFYDKIHMFDVKLSNSENYNESKLFQAGNEIETADLPWGRLGMSICYDMRFPAMYRKMSQSGAKFFSVPSAFTETTGKKHWHTLLRARAIENFCYVFAPAQVGIHSSGRKTYGHSLIISPDGKILAEMKKGEGHISAKIDTRLSYSLREKIPSLNLD